MKLKIKNTNKLSTKLISFLPILKSGIDELYEEIKKISEDNPLIEVKNNRLITFNTLKKSITEEIETLTTYKKSLYEELIDEVEISPLFPTYKSKRVAYEIIKYISRDGFFEGNENTIAKDLNIKIDEVKKVRERFMYLSDTGIGSKDIKECFLFQLYNLDINDDLFKLTKKIILDLENLFEYEDNYLFKEALKIINSMTVIPAIDFFKEEYIIPEIIILKEDNNLYIKINEEYYPEIEIDYNLYNKIYKDKLKEAKSLIDALELRKATLKKISLMIVEYQYDFFLGGPIKPMRIKDIAYELEYSPSTISRAISNKYLLCNRGLIPLKSFFSTALDEEISSKEIKEEIKRLIKIEDRDNPLSDEKLTEIINKKYNLNLVRRTISKYRDSLNIPSSRERKKLYKVKL